MVFHLFILYINNYFAFMRMSLVQFALVMRTYVIRTRIIGHLGLSCYLFITHVVKFIFRIYCWNTIR